MLGFDCPSVMGKRVGRFYLALGHVCGPAEYMRERGNDLVEQILIGEDVIFRSLVHDAPIGEDGVPDFDTLLLERVQSDFLAWKSQRSI